MNSSNLLIVTLKMGLAGICYVACRNKFVLSEVGEEWQPAFA